MENTWHMIAHFNMLHWIHLQTNELEGISRPMAQASGSGVQHFALFPKATHSQLYPECHVCATVATGRYNQALPNTQPLWDFPRAESSKAPCGQAESRPWQKTAGMEKNERGKCFKLIIGFRSRFSQCVDYMRFNEKSFCFRWQETTKLMLFFNTKTSSLVVLCDLMYLTGNISSVVTKHMGVQRKLHPFAYLIVEIILLFY